MGGTSSRTKKKQSDAAPGGSVTRRKSDDMGGTSSRTKKKQSDAATGGSVTRRKSDEVKEWWVPRTDKKQAPRTDEKQVDFGGSVSGRILNDMEETASKTDENQADVAGDSVRRRQSDDGRGIMPESSAASMMGQQRFYSETNIKGDQFNIQTQVVFNMGNKGEQQGNTAIFDLDICKQELIRFYKLEMSRVQLLPWCDEARDMDDIYVSLELEQEKKQRKTLANNEDLVTLETSQNLPATRVLVKALAGSGKTTLLTKLAYNWSQQNDDSSLAKFELLFILSLREINRGCSLIDAIFQQLLAVDTKISKESLKTFFETHADKVLILLDGFDEYLAQTLSSQEGNIERILYFKELRDCRIILSTRPYEHLGRHQSYYVSVKLTGFSPANVELYMTKFFSGNTEMVEGLNKKIQESELLISLSTIPVMLMLLCLLWEDDQSLPSTQSEIYLQFTLYLWRKYCVRHGKQVQFDEDDKRLKGELSETISRLGEVALDGLLPQTNIKEETLVFSEKDFGELFQLGCQTGLLTREKLRSKLNRYSSVTFLHKSFQEFCAAHFWACTHSFQFYFILQQFKTWGVILSKIEIVKFCCGLVGKAEAISIIQHAISMYRESMDLGNEITIGDILPILIMLYESQIPNDDNLTMSLKSLISVDSLVVVNDHPQILPIWHYFIKSEFGLPTLNTIKSVKFDDLPKDSLDVITDALACMPNVQCICIQFKLIDKSVASEYSINQLGVRIAALSKLTDIADLCGRGLDISVLLHHLSISPNICRLKHICLMSVVYNPTMLTNMVQLLSNLEYLNLNCCPCMDLPSMQSLLDAIHSQIKTLRLYNIHVGDAIRHIGHIIPHLQTLELWQAKLGEDHIKILCEFLPRASNLQCLGLSYNTVGMAIVPLAQQLQHCTKLATLRLSKAQITDHGVIELAVRFANLPNLECLDINGNDIHNTGLDAVFKHIHHLTKLRDLSISASIDNQSSPIVRVCLAAIGKAINDEEEKYTIALDIDQIKLIINVAKTCMEIIREVQTFQLSNLNVIF